MRSRYINLDTLICIRYIFEVLICYLWFNFRFFFINIKVCNSKISILYKIYNFTFIFIRFFIVKKVLKILFLVFDLLITLSFRNQLRIGFNCSELSFMAVVKKENLLLWNFPMFFLTLELCTIVIFIIFSYKPFLWAMTFINI